MSILGTAALISGGLSFAKGVIGGIQGFGANKQIKSLRENRPTYTRPQEIEEMMDLYKQSAARNKLPGQDRIEAKLGRATAGGVRQAERFAPSSASALGAVTDIYGQEQDAIRDLGIQFAEYKSARERELAMGYGRAAEYSDNEFYYNKQLPYETRMNELQSQKQAGFGNMWEGVEGAASSYMNFAGTKYLADALKGTNQG